MVGRLQALFDDLLGELEGQIRSLSIEIIHRGLLGELELALAAFDNFSCLLTRVLDKAILDLVGVRLGFLDDRTTFRPRLFEVGFVLGDHRLGLFLGLLSRFE